jgi:hypothetical protein
VLKNVLDSADIVREGCFNNNPATAKSFVAIAQRAIIWGVLVIERLRACKGWAQECVIQAENGGLAHCNVRQTYDD